MKLYSVNYRGELTTNSWSIVTIHKTLEGAEAAKQEYENNWSLNEKTNQAEYKIYIIDTDINSDIVYDYDQIDVEYD